MARYRRVDVKVWRDGLFQSLGDDARLLWFYLLTSPQTTPPGIYTLSWDIACRDLGWATKKFRETFDEVCREGAGSLKWDPKCLVLWLPKWLRYNPPTNPNSVRSWIPVIESLPEESPLILEWYLTAQQILQQYSEPIRRSMATSFGHLSITRIQEAGSRKQEQDQKQEVLVPEAEPPPVPDRIDFDYDSRKWKRRPTAEEIRLWKSACPGIDLEAEMAKATIHLQDLPKNARKKDHKKFLNNWFNRAQRWADGRTR